MPPVSARTRLRFTLFSGLVSAFVCAGPAAAALGFHGDRGDVKREIVRLELAWRDAQIAEDLPAIDRLLAEDYVGVNVTGQVTTKAQFLNRLRRHDLTLTRIDLRDMRIKLDRDIAVVTVRAKVQGSSYKLPLSGEFRYTRIYHQLPSGTWKITHFEATRIREIEVARNNGT